MVKPLFIAKQSGRPRGWFGHVVAHVMSRETASANRVALSHLAVAEGDAVLEVGFGHGRTVHEILQRVPRTTVAGVDPSDVMVRLGRRRCRAYADRIDVRNGEVESLPFGTGAFDRALTVHTTYFWRNLETGLAEIRRVLRDGGRFVLGFRPADDDAAASSLPKSIYTLHSTEGMKTALSSAGFSDITLERTELARGFIVYAICG